MSTPELRPLNPDDAAAWRDAQLDAIALIEASIECRISDLTTMIEPHMQRPYWLINALMSICNTLILSDDNPRAVVAELRTTFLSDESPTYTTEEGTHDE
jgi:hypothetical protein